MKKKNLTSKDKKDWFKFIKNLEDVYDKENFSVDKDKKQNKTKKLDLHGCSLSDANVRVEDFIIKSYENNIGKILIVTGKGSRSKVDNDPYKAKEMNILKFSVPDYINNNENLKQIIKKFCKAEQEDGGEGAFWLVLNKRL